jgi:hypothetical protein
LSNGFYKRISRESAKGITSRAKSSHQHCARSEKRGAIAKCYCRACQGPKQADNGARNKIANSIDSGQHAEGHAVVSLVNAKSKTLTNPEVQL